VKNNLSSYLREVRRGGVVRVTDRGVVVAELRPPARAGDAEALYEQSVAEGKILPPLLPWSAALVTSPRTGVRLPAGFANFPRQSVSHVPIQDRL
jgi:antitoxin (DNA-binding transcriptional repressor) of toxin-antitoxin stability system